MLGKTLAIIKRLCKQFQNAQQKSNYVTNKLCWLKKQCKQLVKKSVYFSVKARHARRCRPNESANYHFACYRNSGLQCVVYQYQYQSHIYLARSSFVIKTQSEARLESEVLIVHVMAEVVSLQVRLETWKCVALS